MSGKDWLSDEAAKHKHTLEDQARLEALKRPPMSEQLRPLTDEQKQAAMDDLQRQVDEERAKHRVVPVISEETERLFERLKPRD